MSACNCSAEEYFVCVISMRTPLYKMKYPYLILLQLLFLSLIFVPEMLAQNSTPEAQCSNPTFLAGKTIPAPDFPGSVASGDVNNDGRGDLVVGISGGLYGNTKIQIKFGDGNGGFTDGPLIPVPSFITGVSFADFNADGNLDVMVLNGPYAETNGFSILLGDGTGSFSPPRTTPLPGKPSDAITGDFDGDDKVDVAVADADFNRIRILYGDDAENFVMRGDFAIGGSPSSLSKADVDGDGRMDLVVGSSSNSVLFFLGQPTGSFAQPVSIPIDPNYNAASASVGDFNGDGKPDILVDAIRQGQFGGYLAGVEMLFGNGNGDFALQPVSVLDYGADFVWTGDVNNDGKLDLVATHSGVNTVKLGNGDGTFGSDVLFYSSVNGFKPIADDFNGDGNIDFLQPGGPNIFLGSGDGHFGDRQIAAGTSPTSIASADFNGDGKPDIVYGDYDGSNLTILTNDGSGAFSSLSIPLVQRPLRVYTPDLNKDGKPDIVAITWETNSFITGHLVILINTGSGFATPILYGNDNGLPARFPRSAAFGDVTGDGVIDIVIGNPDPYGYLIVLRGAGDGTFSTIQNYQLGSNSFYYPPYGVGIGDFDHDGKMDIVTLAARNLLVLKGNGDGSFGVPVMIPAPGANQSEMAVADFNHDGNLDLVLTNNTPAFQSNYISYVAVMLGNGSGGFSDAVNYQVGTGDSMITVADFNNDNELDIAVSGGYISGFRDNRVGVLYGSGDGTFGNVQRFVAGWMPYGIASGDFDSDGKTDIVTANYYGSDISLLLNQCQSPPPTGFPTVSIASAAAVTEGDSGTTDVPLTLSLSAPSSRAISVDYYTSAGTSNGSADYVTARRTVNFAPNETSKVIHILVKGELVDENEETFHVFISNPRNAIVGNKDATITIHENGDPPPLVNTATFSVNEGNAAGQTINVPINLSLVSGKPISVNYHTVAGTAAENVDFVPTSGTLQLPAGSTSGLVSVVVNGDTLVEPDAVFYIAIDAPFNAVIGTSQSPVTLINDDFGGSVQFGSQTYNVLENGGVGVFTITRINGQASNITVQYSTSDGTASAGADYAATTGTVTFGANETFKQITVPIINDSLDEVDPETINLTVSGVSGGASLGNLLTSVLNIRDDDPLPATNIDSITVVEGNTSNSVAIVPVHLQVPSGRVVTVNYQTVSGTATSPDDFLPASGTITFAPGETFKNVSVTIVGDRVIEPNETFNVVLSAPINTSLANSSAVVSISNDDASVTVGGRVLTSDGAGLKNAAVTMADSLGVRRTALTNSFGFFSFDSVAAGESYTITATSKRFRFSGQTVQITGNLTLPTFVGLE